MSDLPIDKMDFKRLRNEVQYLRDELAMMKRHYEDLLYNLDDDNIISISADKIKGFVNAEGITTDSLYAEYGDIADLTVDRISTAKRVKKYLRRDVTQDNYFEGYDKGIYFVQGIVMFDENNEPIVEQLTNRYGVPLWWNGVISYVSGDIPYDEEDRQLLITEKSTSGEPVVVYKYQKNVKLKIEFWTDVVTGNANPRITLGIGTDTTGMSDAGKADIEKTAEGLSVRYVAESGEPYKLVFKNDGIYQVRTDGESKLPFMYIRDTTPPDTMGRDGDVCFVKL